MKRVWLPLVVLSACAPPPATQAVLYLDTDAPLPGSSEHPALFDTLRVDVYMSGQLEPCLGCSREIALDRAMFAAAEVSFGVLMEPGRDGYVVRARLFRARYQVGGDPAPSASVDAFVQLPSVGEGEIAEYHFVLSTDHVAEPLGTRDEPVAPQAGRLRKSAVGSWIHARPCSQAPREGEVCVPGGAFWMGSPRVVRTTIHDPALEEEARVDEQRLVVLSPFFLDATEVTVGAYPQSPELPLWSEDHEGDDVYDFYTWSVEPERAALPVNGIIWDEARAFCQTRGGDLPTEAQLEFVAGGLRGDDYPWGNDVPACEDAVWGRGGVGPFIGHSHSCRPEDEIGGPLPVGSGAADRLSLAGGAIVDVAGNVSEWTLDGWASQDSDCWPSGIVRNPLCRDYLTHPQVRTVRGGNWAQPAAGLLAAVRGAERPIRLSALIGFRCARPDGATP
jgi:formylglycine-generating enzyme required for sulfatase activity